SELPFTPFRCTTRIGGQSVVQKHGSKTATGQASISMVSISPGPDLAHGGAAVYAVHHDEHHTPGSAGGYPRPFGETARGGRAIFRVHRHAHPYAPQRARDTGGAGEGELALPQHLRQPRDRRPTVDPWRNDPRHQDPPLRKQGPN